MLGAALALAGCDAGPRDDEPLGLPAVHLAQILAQQLVPGSSPPSYAYLPLDLEHGSSSVTPRTSFFLQFDRFLLPGPANRQGICIRPLLGSVLQPGDCSFGIELRPAYDPVRRQIAYRVDNPTQLSGQTRYELTLYSADTPELMGILSFDGVALATPIQVEFEVTGDPAAQALPYDAPPTGDHYCTAPPVGHSVSEIFSGCALGGCHGISPGVDAGANLPSEGLNLGSAAFVLATALGKAAHETETGEAASSPDQNGARFGRAMPIVDPAGGPGNSYLVYKLLANHAMPLQVPFTGATDPLTGDPLEISRLRSELVVGMPMPPGNAPPISNLSAGDAEWLSDWIAAGATLCP